MNVNGIVARKWIAGTALAAGLAVGAAGVAGAATSGTSSTSTTAKPAASTARIDPAKLKNGPGETLLTGSTAASVTAAAKAAVSGATVIRVETDAQGAAYEAHLQKADGSVVTIKLDKSFKVTATQHGFGGPAGGAHAPQGAAPSA